MIHQIPNSRGNYNYNAFFYDSLRWDSHFHKNFELIYCEKGKNSVVAGGNSFLLSPGEWLLIPPGTLHSFTVSDGRLWIGVFSSDFVSLFHRENKNRMFSPFRCDEETEAYLKSVLLQEGVPDRYCLKSALYAVCHQCLLHASLLEKWGDGAFSSRVLTYLSENFEKPLTMGEVCEEFGYEFHYFSKRFHDTFGMNFRELLNLCRFEKACELLEKTDKPLTEIALESGFQSIRNFNTVFKKFSGTTPSAYAKTWVSGK